MSVHPIVSQDLPHISSNFIYDEANDVYRPIKTSDFNGGYGGSDAFGRTRVSDPETIFSSKQIFDNEPLYFDDVQASGSGTDSVHNADTASTVLSVSGDTAGKRVRQSKMRFNYQPSKSQLIFITFVLNKSGANSGIKRKVGYFDDDNGLYLENDNGTIYLVRRTLSTGSVQNIRTAQSSWNLDKLDGSGNSKKTIDLSKAQILVIDFEWLGVGRVRFGFNIDGVIYYVHELLNANNLDGVYMSTPNLPIRFEIENDGNGGSASLESICCAVVSEGGKEELSLNRYVSNPGSVLAADPTKTYPILGLKLKDAYLGATIDILGASLLCTSNDDFEWKLLLNPILSGTFNYSNVTDSSIQLGTGISGCIVSGSGIALAGGFAAAKAEIGGEFLKNQLKLGAKIDGTLDEIILAIKAQGNNSIIYGGVNYREFI